MSKAGIISKLALAVLSALAPAQSMILSALCLILADLVLGLIAAYRAKQPITSAGLRRTIVKLFVYEMAIILGYIAQTYLIHDLIPVASIISGFIGMTEVVSCMENLNAISGNNLLESLIKKLGSANESDSDKK